MLDSLFLKDLAVVGTGQSSDFNNIALMRSHVWISRIFL